MSVIKVKPWGQGQGDHVLIEESDFIAGFHEKLDGRGRPTKEESEKKKEAEKVEPKA